MDAGRRRLLWYILVLGAVLLLGHKAYSQVELDMIANGHTWLHIACFLACILSVLLGLRNSLFLINQTVCFL